MAEMDYYSYTGKNRRSTFPDHGNPSHRRGPAPRSSRRVYNDDSSSTWWNFLPSPIPPGLHPEGSGWGVPRCPLSGVAPA